MTLSELWHRLEQYITSSWSWWRRPKAEPEAQPEAPKAEAPPEPSVKPSRDEARRRFELARMKHDKFLPVRKRQRIKGISPRKARRIKIEAEAQIQAAASDDSLIVDDHFYSEGTDKVLYGEGEFLGEFYFRDTILDQLDRYWIYLSRMKRHDIDSYEFYKILGAVIVPPIIGSFGENRDELLRKLNKEEIAEIKLDHSVTPWFNKVRPGFGCVACAIDPTSEQRELRLTEMIRKQPDYTKRSMIYKVKFVYFVKYSHAPPEVARLGIKGDIYKMTVWFDRPHDPTGKIKAGVPEQFAVHVDQTGKVRVLPVFGFHGWYWKEWL